MKIFWGVDDGNITGARRFHAYVGAVLVICVAFGTLLARTPRREGSMGDTRLGPIALALDQSLAEGSAAGEVPTQAPGDAGEQGVDTG